MRYCGKGIIYHNQSYYWMRIVAYLEAWSIAMQVCTRQHTQTQKAFNPYLVNNEFDNEYWLLNLNLLLQYIFSSSDINECASNPCLNGAICTDEVNRYHCACLVGYRGAMCEESKSTHFTAEHFNISWILNNVNCRKPAFFKGTMKPKCLCI